VRLNKGFLPAYLGIELPLLAALLFALRHGLAFFCWLFGVACFLSLTYLSSRGSLVPKAPKAQLTFAGIARLFRSAPGGPLRAVSRIFVVLLKVSLLSAGFMAVVVLLVKAAEFAR
jgi:hypothetical protein